MAGDAAVPLICRAICICPCACRACAPRMPLAMLRSRWPSVRKSSAPVLESGAFPRTCTPSLGPAEALTCTCACVRARLAVASTCNGGTDAMAELPAIRKLLPFSCTLPSGLSKAPESLAESATTPVAFKPGTNGCASAGVILRISAVTDRLGLSLPATSSVAGWLPGALSTARRRSRPSVSPNDTITGACKRRVSSLAVALSFWSLTCLSGRFSTACVFSAKGLPDQLAGPT